MTSVLQITNLEKSFGRRKIIDNISFEVQSGEVFGFLGPNGAGKTTTIKMIMGFLSMDQGSIQINSHDLRRDYERAMAGVGGIVENPEMYSDLSGRTNLEMYARLHEGITPGRIDEVIALVGMQQRCREKVKRYSLGMKQRICLAQALLHKPNLLILDEPTNGLDPAGIKELRDILKYLAHQDHVAVMVSSHQLAEMELMCDRVGIIDRGRLLGVKPISELLAIYGGKEVYRFLTPQAARAVEILTAGYEGKLSALTDNSFEIELVEEQVPLINRYLVNQNIPIHGISKVSGSLEDAFMQITGGGLSIA
ncbi:MAG TPA: bacitracin ABC transporter ATP-binding protein [Clostridiales bacterium]|nr:bacitracin ABC transporter ATP-binding protein [Clostridiales bacterium]